MFNFLNTTPDGGYLLNSTGELHPAFFILPLSILVLVIIWILFQALKFDDMNYDERGSKVYKKQMKKFAGMAIILSVLAAPIIIVFEANAGIDKLTAVNSVEMKEWANNRYDINLGDKAIEKLLIGEKVETKNDGVIKLRQAEDDGFYLMFATDDNKFEAKELPVKNK